MGSGDPPVFNAHQSASYLHGGAGAAGIVACRLNTIAVPSTPGGRLGRSTHALSTEGWHMGRSANGETSQG